MENLKRLFKRSKRRFKNHDRLPQGRTIDPSALRLISLKKHQLTPTQFSVLETLYSKGDLRIQDLIDSILATSEI